MKMEMLAQDLKLLKLEARTLTSNKAHIVRLKSKDIARGLKHGYRSGLERQTGEQLRAAGMSFEFESLKLKYVQPEQVRSYTPDFILDNGIIIETKGRFLPQDRKKMLLVKEQYPKLDIRFVFSNAHAPMYKGSKTSLSKWASKQGFKWAHRTIPIAWLKEPKKLIREE